MAQSDDLIGRQFDNYIVVSRLARGGMADVYLARHVRLEREVALKVMLPSFVENEAFVERFRREALAMARLQHNGIVQVYDTGDTPDGRPYIAMQYVRGGTLDELLARLEGEGQMMSPQFALAITRQVAAALQVAHNAGIIHRDLKPSNILLDEQRRPILTDLGIAYVQDTQRLTRTDAFIGTPHYMSPEQGKGLPLDARSDIYSLGVVLFEMLVGQRPFPGDSHWALIHAHVATPAPAPSKLRPGLPGGVDRIVGRCLEKEPGRRFQSANELAAAIDQALADFGAAGVLTASGEWQWSPRQSGEWFVTRAGKLRSMDTTGSKRRPTWLIPGALAFLGGLAALWLIFGRGPSNPVSPSATQLPGSTIMATVIVEVTREVLPTSTNAPTTGPGTQTQETATAESTASAPPPTATSDPGPATSVAPTPGAVTARVLNDIFTRSGPGMSFSMGAALSQGDVVPVLGRDQRGDWFIVQPPRGGPVWVSAGFIAFESGSASDVVPAATIPALPTPTSTATQTPSPTNPPPIGGGGSGGGSTSAPPDNTVVSPPIGNTVVSPPTQTPSTR